MERIFLRLVSMSMSAGWLVLAVVLLRQLLRRSPRRIVCLLWALVALRLLCPLQLTWGASLVPSQETVARTAQSTLELPAETVPSDAPAGQGLVQTLSCVWLAGAAAMVLWAAVSDVRLRARLRGAVRLSGNVWQSARIDTPFVLGVVQPHIYLPPGLGPEQSAYVLAHERAHISRGDHVWKPLGWLLLSVYWFQPMLWVAYALLCRDLELACDERVARGLDRAGLADYAETLLNCGCRRRSVPVSPVAFGEVGVKARVKAVLRYQKPVFRRVALALAAVAVTGAFFLTERPATALQPAELRPAAEETSADGKAEALTAEAEPDAPSSSSDMIATPAAAQQDTDQASDAQAQMDAYIRQLNAEQARKNQEAAAANQQATANSAQSQQTVGWQSAIDVQPQTPTAPAMPDPNPTNQIGVVQNGDTYAIRIFP